MDIPEWLLKLDILAPSTQLRVAGNTSSKSFIGVFLFLAYLGLLAYTGYSQYVSYSDTTQPSVTTDLRYRETFPDFKLIEEGKIPMFLGMLDSVDFVKPEVLNQYLTLKLWVSTYTLNVGTGVYDHTIEDVPFVTCKSLIDSGVLRLKDLKGVSPTYLDIIPEYGMCLNTTGYDLTVVGSAIDSVQKVITFGVSPCSLPGGIGCKPAAEVNKMWIQILNWKHGLDVTNQKNPVNFKLDVEDLLVVNTDTMQLYKFEMVQNEIVDSFGYLMPNSETKRFSVPERKSMNWVSRDPTVTTVKPEDIHFFKTRPYIYYYWVSGTKFNLIRRNYQGVIDLVRNIGGINSIIWIATYLVYVLIHPRIEKRNLVAAVYGIQQSSTSWCACKRKVHNASVPTSKLVAREGEEPQQTNTKTSNSTYTIVSKEVFEKAYASIRADLDVVTICKELQVLRILSKLLLKNHLKEVIPVAALCDRLRISEQPSRRSNTQLLKDSTLGVSRVPSLDHADIGIFLSTICKQPKIPLVSQQVRKDPSDHKPVSDSAFRLLGEPGVRDSPVQALLEGLEEEFNKLIRGQLLGTISEPVEQTTHPKSKEILGPEKVQTPEAGVQPGLVSGFSSTRQLIQQDNKKGSFPSTVKLQKRIVIGLPAKDPPKP